MTVSPASPTLVTTPSSTIVTLGSTAPTLTDSAVLSGGYNETGTITFTLYYNGGTTPVDTETVTVNGNGTYTTPTGYTLPATGTVTGSYQWDASYSGDGNNNSASDNNNDQAEQVTVSPASPTLVTTPSSTVVTLGSTAPTLSDSAVLSGGYYETGTITFTLYYNGGTTPVDSETVTVNGNGIYTTPTGYTLPATGTVTGAYQWDASYGGDGNNNSASDNNDPAEQVTVSPASPTLVTTPSSIIITLDLTAPTLTDSAVLSGGYYETGTIIFTLYYNGGTMPVDTETVTVNGNGIYTTPTGYTLPTTGTVTGSYQWDASYGGDGNNNSASDNNDPAEQVTVNPASPTLVTTPSSIIVTLGSTAPTLTDSAVLSGGYYETGTITFTLYYNGGSTPVDTETVTVNGNGSYTTPTGYTLPATDTVTGSYQWDASYGGDGNNNSASDNNDPAEQVTVSPASPTITTQAAATAGGVVGTAILTDTATLAGGYLPGGTISFALTDPHGHLVTLPANDQSVTVSGDGAYTTPAGIVATEVGIYDWSATYSGDANNNPASEPATTSNLIVNGDFSAGNTGFTSQYLYSPGNLSSDTSYDIGTDPQTDNPSGLSFGDHTTGSGLMMLVNGATNSGVILWAETVNVTPNQTYSLCAWMAQWAAPRPFSTMEFLINGVQAGSDFTNTAAGTWQQFSSIWNSGSATQAAITIVDLNLDYSGNDFALDDISFGPAELANESLLTIKACTTTTVSSSTNPSVFGQSVTYTATVSVTSPGVGLPTGTVTFSDGSTSLGTAAVSSGQATFSSAALSVSTHTITASYSGDNNFIESTSGDFLQTVNQASTTTTVASSTNPSDFGQCVTFTATVGAVAPGAGTPTGIVTFLDSGTTLGTATLGAASGLQAVANFAIASGMASPTSGTLQFGDQDVLGTDSYSSDPTAGAILLGLAPNVITLANLDTWHASLPTPSAGDYPGTDQIFVGSTQTNAHDGYSQWITRQHGPQVITLDYGSLAPVGNQVQTFTLGIAANDFQFPMIGQPFTAQINGVINTALTDQLNALDQTGPVVQFFTIGIDPATLAANNILTLSIDEAGDGGDGWAVDFLTVGVVTSTTSNSLVLSTTGSPHSITAVYNGDTNFTGSTSDNFLQTVNQSSTTTTVTSSVNPSVFGHGVTFTATCSSQWSVVSGQWPTGTVMFEDGGTSIGTATLSGGVATYSTSSLTVSVHSITAVYGGDTICSGSTSASYLQTVVSAYIVTNTSYSSTEIGSLPWAVGLAALNGSGPAITINFDPVVFATAQNIALAGTLNLGNGTPGESIIIDGPAASLTIQGGGSGSNFSVITVAANTTAILENLTISNGYTSGNGGGVLNNGILTVSNTTVFGNHARAGGGICNAWGGTMAVTNSRISDNLLDEVWSGGGGIYNCGTLTVSNSTVSSNYAGPSGGGGGINNEGTLMLNNSTLFGNSADNNGGGINNSGTLTVSNSTVCGNSAAWGAGGGILVGDGCNITLFSTIVAGNSGRNPDVHGLVTSDSAYNLIGDGTGMTGISDGDANHNQVGTSSSPIDPLLAPLGNYGGPTQTMALRPDSPALSAGEIVDGITTDQRGYPRPTSNPDIGAYQSSFFVNNPALAGPGVVVGGTTSLVVDFSGPVLGGNTVSNYDLQRVGADGLLGTEDDIHVPHTVIYSGTTATLSFTALPESVYRLTVKDTIIDTTTGNPLDGDGDGTPGGNYVRDFVVSGTPGPLLFGSATTFAAGGSDVCQVVVADVNKDGNPNIVVTNMDNNTVSVLLGNGTGGFGSVTTFTAGSLPSRVAVADVNKDGNPDIVVGNWGSGTVAVLLGNGTGGFGSATTFPTGGFNNSFSPQEVAVADVNGDGNPDIVVANHSSDTVGVLLGNGTGGFGSATTFPTGGSRPITVVVADVNKDGNPDIIVTNCSSDNVGVLLGNGTGGFGSATTFPTGGSTPAWARLADVNRDGNLNIVAANYSSDNVGVLLGDGTGWFGSATTFASGESMPTPVAVVDMNRDGNPDIVVANYGSDDVGVLLGDGTGRFSSATTFPSGGIGPMSMAVADVNKDGNPDIVVVNRNSNPANVGVLLGNGPPVADLYTPNNFLFDIRETGVGAGQFLQGTRNAFDGDNRLQVGSQVDGQMVWSDFQPDAGPGQTFLDDGGRTVVTPVQTLAGLNVHREITVPLTPAPLPGGEGSEDFARTVDVFENPTGSPITTTVHIVGNLGSDAATTVFTPNGGTTPDVNDQWIGTDDANGTGTPAIIHYIHGPFGLKPTAVNVTGDNIDWTYTITVMPGETVRLASFTIVSTWRADAIAAANALVTPSGFGGQAAVFLSTEEINSLANFRAETTTELTSSVNPSVYGQSVTFTATCSGQWSAVSGQWPTGTVTFSDGGTSLGTGTLNGSGTATVTTTSLLVGSHTITAVYNGDANFSSSTSAPLSQVVNDGAIVTSFTATSTGFTAVFNHTLNLGGAFTPILNLYDNSTGNLGPADVTLTGTATGPISGSLVVDAVAGPSGSDGATRITFIQTGQTGVEPSGANTPGSPLFGVLPDGTYTVTLRTATNGFQDTSGHLLDGNADGTPGDAFVTTFVVDNPSNAVVVSLPDFARGPGQAVNGTGGTGGTDGIPLRLLNNSSATVTITSVTLNLAYDPNLLTVSGAATLGLAVVTYSSPTGIVLGPNESAIFATVTASVPSTAGYQAKEILDLQDININGGSFTSGNGLAIDDAAIHVSGFIGDATGDGIYTGLDAQRISRVSVGLDPGFRQWVLVDPLIVGDVNGDNQLTGLDALQIARQAVGITQSNIPVLPAVTPVIVGPDPVVSIGQAVVSGQWSVVSRQQAAGSGQQAAGGRQQAAGSRQQAAGSAKPQAVVVPVNLDHSDGLASVNLAISYDTSRVDVASAADVVRGSLTQSFDNFTVNIDGAAGIIYISGYRSAGPLAGFGSGSLALISFQVRADAPAGPAVINLLENAGSVRTALGGTDAQGNDFLFDLEPRPSNVAGDVLDGRINVSDALALPFGSRLNDALNDDDVLYWNRRL